MRYKPGIEFVHDKNGHLIDQTELSEVLKINYGYPLLNFAYIIADVLAGIPVFSKAFFNKKATAIMHEAACLEALKTSLLESLISYLKRAQPALFDALERTSPEERIRFLTILFRLKPFFEVIEDFRLPSRLIRKMAAHPLDPNRFAQLQKPLSEANQVSFFWAHSLRKRAVEWYSILNLMTWFIGTLNNSNYIALLDFPSATKGVGGNTRVLKNQYIQFQKSYYWWYFILCYSKYFPAESDQPHYYSESLNHSESTSSVFKVNFYKNRIETIFLDREIRKVRETVFGKHKIRTSVYDFDPVAKHGKRGPILSVG